MIRRGHSHPTVFELITAIMFMYFKEEKVDLAVLEVGLGGRIDSTNVIDNSLVSVITTIDYDHMAVLGDTLYKIGSEKAGIIKENGIVVSYPQNEEALKALLEKAEEKNANFIICPMSNIKIHELNDRGAVYDFQYDSHKFDKLVINLVGKHQVYNSVLALTTILELRDKGIINISNEEIRNGLMKTRWNGRLEVISREPIFLIDGAHNKQGIEALISSLKLFNYDRLILGVGILKDKDVSHMVEILSPLADEIIATEVDSPRKMEANELAEMIKKYNKNVRVEKDIRAAVEKSIELANKNDLIVFAGSIYMIGDVRKIVLS